MQGKRLFLWMLWLGVVASVLAYSAGKDASQLDSTQTSFIELRSEKNNKQLTSEMRNLLISKVGYRLSNHEQRLWVFAKDPNYPELKVDQYTFNNLKSTQHWDILTAQMRDELVNKLSIAAENHEMRIRKGCSVPDPVIPDKYHCIGTYKRTIPEYWVWKEARPQCYRKDVHSNYGIRNIWQQATCNYEKPPFANERLPNNSFPDEPDYIQMVWFFDDTSSKRDGPIPCMMKLDYSQDVELARGLESFRCKYSCVDKHPIDKCTKIPSKEEIKDCFSFNEYSCKSTAGCSRVKAD